jgi:alpha-L-fucosidase 2
LPANTYYKIRAKHSNRIADVNWASMDNGAQIVQSVDWGGTNQMFNFEATTGGFYKIRAKHSNLVWDVANASMSGGASIVQAIDWSSPNQSWCVTQVSGVGAGAVYQIVAKHSGMVAEVASASSDNGAPFQQGQSLPGDHQLFYLDAQ